MLPWFLSGKNPTPTSAMWKMGIGSLSQESPLEKEMATPSSILSWKSPMDRETGRLQSIKELDRT